VLSTFSRQHPSVSVSVIEDITPSLLDRLHEGSIDLAVLALPVAGDELVAVELSREPLFAAFPERHRLAKRRSVGLDEIRDEPFLLLKEGHCFRDNALSACRRSRVNPNVVFESGQFATILAMVSAGMGVSVVPEMAVSQISGCSFVPITDTRNERRIGAVRLKHRYPTRAHLALLQHLETSAAGWKKAS
jgi:LysR family hydrogen peroxide-inducible transcriptional activator